MMMEKHDCEIFQQRLDALEGTRPPEAELEELEMQAAGCRDCETILDACLHLAGPSRGELEAEVPAKMVDSMWTRVSSRTIGRPSGLRRWAFGRVLVPALAATVVLLVFALGFMLGELRHLRGIEDRMAMMIERREETIASMQARSDETPGLLASERFRGLLRRRFLQERNTYRVSELISFLEKLPQDTKILSAQEVDALLGRGGTAAYSPYSTRLRMVDYTNGLDAGEAILLIEALGIDTDELIPREQIASLRGI
jgi:hypothetical protein